jgi:hypothetical protein
MTKLYINMYIYMYITVYVYINGLPFRMYGGCGGNFLAETREALFSGYVHYYRNTRTMVTPVLLPSLPIGSFS